ncbi:hypothetical protein TWF970_005790 [Orbilia oligospora]|uniref:Uncharacterized protein n=1 Tax=Orbilia oligospora TaxID=2813651 RepID=A0A7C8RPB6_ORBOL|nr:hypothetical protein TWF970_005790 [Orbilia oligospora]
MKFTTILSALAILTPALSGITIERLPDGVGLKAISVPDDVSRIKKRMGGCNRDNCLRAMTARISTASQFCPSFTTDTVTATTGLGPWQTQCGSNPTRVSSACSCLVPNRLVANQGPIVLHRHSLRTAVNRRWVVIVEAVTSRMGMLMMGIVLDRAMP